MKKNRNALKNDFFKIVKKAHDKGLNDNITVYKLIEEIKNDLKKYKID